MMNDIHPTYKTILQRYDEKCLTCAEKLTCSQMYLHASEITCFVSSGIYSLTQLNILL